MSNRRLDALEVAIGKLTPQRGSILCGVTGFSPAQGWSLAGKVVGPFSSRASTLPATFALKDLGPGENVLAQAIVLDPVCWSPELPARYRVQVELRQHGIIVEQAERMFGIRWLEVRDGGFYWQGRRAVLRGLELDPQKLPLDEAATRAWLTTEMACLVAAPTDEVCEWGSAAGIPILADVTKFGSEQLPQTLARLAHHAAVLMVLLNPTSAIDRQQLPPVSSLMLAADLRQQTEIVAPDWADVLLADERQIAQLAKLPQTTKLPAGLPLIVTATGAQNQSPAEARDACDQLRTRLAALRQCAGYAIAKAI